MDKEALLSMLEYAKKLERKLGLIIEGNRGYPVEVNPEGAKLMDHFFLFDTQSNTQMIPYAMIISGVLYNKACEDERCDREGLTGKGLCIEHLSIKKIEAMKLSAVKSTS